MNRRVESILRKRKVYSKERLSTYSGRNHRRTGLHHRIYRWLYGVGLLVAGTIHAASAAAGPLKAEEKLVEYVEIVATPTELEVDDIRLWVRIVPISHTIDRLCFPSDFSFDSSHGAVTDVFRASRAMGREVIIQVNRDDLRRAIENCELSVAAEGTQLGFTSSSKVDRNQNDVADAFDRMFIEEWPNGLISDFMAEQFKIYTGLSSSHSTNNSNTEVIWDRYLDNWFQLGLVVGFRNSEEARARFEQIAATMGRLH